MLKKLENKLLKIITKKKNFFFRLLKVIYFSIDSFIKDKCTLRASGLTYFSLMAIVPFFALLFGIGKIFGYQAYLENELMQKYIAQKDLLEEVIKFANNLLLEARGGIIALVGTVFLFWSLVQLFSNMQSSLDVIFKTQNPRGWKKKISLTFSMLFIVPIFIVLMSIVKVYLIKTFSSNLIVDTFFEQIFLLFLKLLPFLLIWALFSFIFLYMPKAKVRLYEALIGGFLSALAYKIVQYVYVNFQVGFTKYNAIYGSFAALPLFLIWLQISWLIFLYGAEVTNNLHKIRKKH